MSFIRLLLHRQVRFFLGLSLKTSSIDNNCCAELQFLSLGTTPGVTTEFVAREDDGFSEAINIADPGFPFGSVLHNVAYVRIKLLHYIMP